MRQAVFIIKIKFFLIVALSLTINSQTINKVGSLKGIVIDSDTKSPLIGANVILVGHSIGAATNTEGDYSISNIPVGNYTVQFRFVGFETVTKTDVIIRSDRTTYINTELSMSAISSDEVVVTSGYFHANEEKISSMANFSYEEIRRSSGAAGDVSRIIMTLPSVAKIDDQKNSLIVRGGSPNENAFYIDNIEIPNINHFPIQGSSGGAISLINVDLIQEVDFYSGGFSSLFGNKLSSVMDIQFREGNRQEFDGQLNLNFAGFGGVFEGPLGKKGSWLLSLNRSYLDFIIDMVAVGSTVAPTYGDVNFKIVYDINSDNRITFLGIFGDEHMHSDRQNGIDNDMIIYAKQDNFNGTTGINWRTLWGQTGYSNTSLSFTIDQFKEDYFRTATDLLFFVNRSSEKSLKFRNVNHLILSQNNTIDFGIDARQHLNEYENYHTGFTDSYGAVHEEKLLHLDFNEIDAGGFLSYTHKIIPEMKINLGLRTDYFSFNERVNFSPRISLNYDLSVRTSLNASVGIYHQNLPSILLTQNSSLKDNKSLSARHYIAGISHLISEDTRISLEAYKKEYQNFPLDPEKPQTFIVDEIYESEGLYTSHENLIDKGIAESWGIEIMLQKKLAKDFYGIISGSYFRSRYKDLNGNWHNRTFDNKFLFNVEGGYKPNEEWEFSLRWVYAGGRPFTPFDIQASTETGTGVFDLNRINNDRLPEYHSMNLRVDKRFHFESTNLVIYLSIWNAYNRKNVAMKFWNEINNEEDTIYQWSLLPILGVEFEF